MALALTVKALNFHRKTLMKDLMLLKQSSSKRQPTKQGR